MDSKHYLELFTKAGGVLNMMEIQTPWLHEPGVIIQHDGASCHTGHSLCILLAVLHVGYLDQCGRWLHPVG